MMIYVPEWLEDEEGGYEVLARKSASPERLQVQMDAAIARTGRQRYQRQSRFTHNSGSASKGSIKFRGRKRTPAA